jgi:transposase
LADSHGFRVLATRLPSQLQNCDDYRQLIRSMYWGGILIKKRWNLVSSELFPPIPAETVKAARAIFGRSNFYLAVGDQANRLFSGICLSSPAESQQLDDRRLAILHLVTVFQYMETLPDLLALDAIRERVDWKYALHLPLRYPFRETSSFCEFRRWLKDDSRRIANFQSILSRLSEVTGHHEVQDFSLQAEQVITSVCRTSRLAKIWDAMSQCLEALAITQPNWLRANSLPHWYDRYGHHSHDENLRGERLEQEAFAQGVGADGFYLLEKVSCGEAPELATLPEVLALQAAWMEQFERSAGVVRWKQEACSQCTQLSNH